MHITAVQRSGLQGLDEQRDVRRAPVSSATAMAAEDLQLGWIKAPKSAPACGF